MAVSRSEAPSGVAAGPIGLGRGVIVRALIALAVAVPLFAWWTSPSASAATRYYDRVMGSNGVLLANAIAGSRVLLMRSPDNPGAIGVFEPELAGGKGQREPVTIVRADRIRVFVPWLIGLALVWPLAGPVAGGQGGRWRWPRGRQEILDFAWRRALLVFGAFVFLFAAHVLTFGVQIIEAYADGSSSLGLVPWAASSRSLWGAVSWFLLLIGGPFFPVLIVAGAGRLLRSA